MITAITGATGFLGLRLLPLLIERGGQVVVLAHAGTAPARERIARHLRAGGLPTEMARDLTVLSTDVTRPRLGLPQWQFQALAEQLTEIWHCAGLIELASSAERLRPVNVGGTRAVLELAAAGTPMLYHVSTAFVAGRRRTGVIGEGDLDASHGFENPYEESKSDGERAVHEWSQRHGRPAVIFRPSVLITDRTPPPGGASHPLRTACTLFDYHADALLRRLAAGRRLPVRLVADPGAHLNLIPVELAAQLMVGLAGRIHPNGVHTVHITHPHEVAVSTLLSLFEHQYPVRLEACSELPSPRDRTLLESLTAARMRGFTPYWLHRRYYDRSELRAAALDPSDTPPLDINYLLGSIDNEDRASGSLARHL